MKAPVYRDRNTPRAKELRNQASPAERRFWTLINKRQVDGFRFTRQYQIGPFYADFLCRAAKLVVKLDGSSHDFTVEQDANRTQFLNAQGYHVIRFTNQDVFDNADGVLMELSLALADMPTPSPSREREGS